MNVVAGMNTHMQINVLWHFYVYLLTDIKIELMLLHKKCFFFSQRPKLKTTHGFLTKSEETKILEECFTPLDSQQ